MSLGEDVREYTDHKHPARTVNLLLQRVFLGDPSSATAAFASLAGTFVHQIPDL